MCQRISEVEWSGVLFYSVKGSIKNYDKMEIVIEDIYLMDKGTAGSTGYELGEDFIEYRMNNPETLKWKIGMIHSHHSMDSYFSGTDMEELEDNTEFHNYYLSLVVNNRGKKVAKVAFRGNINGYECLDETGQPWNLSLTKKKIAMFTFDCKISEPQTLTKVPKEFSNRASEIIEKSKANKEAYKKGLQNFKPNHNSKLNPTPFDFRQGGNFTKIGGTDISTDKEMDEIEAEMWNNSFSTETNIKEDEDSKYENFIALLLNYGNTVPEGEDMETILAGTEEIQDKLGYLNSIITLYPAVFEKYWNVFGEINTEFFCDVTITVIAYLEDYLDVYEVVEPLTGSLEVMLNSMITEDE